MLSDTVTIGRWTMESDRINTVNNAIIACSDAIDISNRWRQEVYVNEQHSLAERILKIVEEVGELSEAYIGYTGQNERKGFTHTLEDLRSEIVDVITSGLVALAGTRANDGDRLIDYVLDLVEQKCLRHAQAVAHSQNERKNW